MINGRTRLHVVANGTMTGQRYIDEVLLPHVRLFRGAVGDKFVFMDDNATCHRTLAVQDCLDSEGIQRLVWTARSPDLNPIENVWDALGRQVSGRNYPPTNKNTLIRALTEEWHKLPQQLLDNVVQKWCSTSVYNHQYKRKRSERNNSGCSFSEAENWRVIFHCGDRVRLTSDHVILLTATLPPQIRPKIGRKHSMKNIRVIQPLRLDGYLDYPYATKALYIHNHPCPLWDLKTGLTAPQSASLTTIPDERHS
ncbi:death-associated protein kinase dapk-1 [Trichonephila clavipes]|nr:death-associated protein kinase dapk-1 [Trichonephila clavipes]